VLAGLVTPDAGDVEVLGGRWGGRDHALRARIGVQLQETRIADRLTVAETVRLFRSFYPRGHDPEAVMALLGLTEKRDAWIMKLSGGQRQRVALACALVSEPELLFLDEPTTGLDPQARLRIWEVVERYLASGGTVVLTTHYMDEAARLCHRLAVVDHGQRIALGTPAELVASLGADQIIELEVTGDVSDEALAALPAVTAATTRGPRRVLTVKDVGVALPALMALLADRGAALSALASHPATLEDMFVHLTGRGLRDA
jgi:ABC-2 type transport system ATP-binding protein